MSPARVAASLVAVAVLATLVSSADAASTFEYDSSTLGAASRSSSRIRIAETSAINNSERAGALPPHVFTFPRDDGAHEAFASEIWRAFGFLTTARGRRIDVSATFFRYAARANPRAANASAWSRPEFFPATFTLADRPAFHFVSRTRFERGGVGLAHAAGDRLDVAAGTWSLRGTREPAWRQRRFALKAARDGAALDLDLVSQRAPVALGPGGVERIGSCDACVAYGYAYTRVRARGSVEIDGVRHDVSGSMWLDHEYGNRRLDDPDTGTFRVAIQFEDGRDLVATAPHGADGNPTAVSGTLVRANGDVVRYAATQLVVGANTRFRWTSAATGASYPSAAYVGVPSEGLAVGISIGPRESEVVEPAGVPSYFTAAAEVGRLDPPDGDHGRAYVESTGYDRVPTP